VLARKKAKAEDDDVDVDGFGEVAQNAKSEEDLGEDGCWADEEADGDREGWKMKVWIEDDIDE
jgi:hypothetical protein